MAKYTDLTDEEYDALDEELTNKKITFGPNATDWLIQREMRLLRQELALDMSVEQAHISVTA
jgi:hypothetical protein